MTTLSKEKPILFSAEMVRAILDGRKSQTRRIIKPQPSPVHHTADRDSFPFRATIEYDDHGLGNVAIGYTMGEIEAWALKYHPGDRLWVKETWAQKPTQFDFEKWVVYHADNEARRVGMGEDETAWNWKKLGYEPRTWAHSVKLWKPSIFMPRWASRITLEILSVRVERVHEITEEDAKAEGIYFSDYGRQCFHEGQGDISSCPAPSKYHPQLPGWMWKPTTSHTQCLPLARAAFVNLWDSLNAKRGFGWEGRPWVWVLTFRRIKP